MPISPSENAAKTPATLQSLVVFFLLVYGLVLSLYGWKLQGRERVDFPTYFYAARTTFVERGSPYAPDAFAAASRELGQPVYPFIYPPPSLLAFAPLAHLSYPVAKGAFTALSVLAYLGAIWLLLLKLMPLPEADRRQKLLIVVTAGYLAVYHASIGSLRIGQINLIALFFLCLALVAMRSPHPAWRTALPLSIAILLKTYPVLLLLPLLFRRRFSEITLTCAFYGMMTLCAAALLPHSIWASWLFGVVPSGSYAIDSTFAQPSNQSINGFVTRLFQPNPYCDPILNNPVLAKPVATIFALLVFGITLLSAYRYHRRVDTKNGGDTEIACFVLVI